MVSERLAKPSIRNDMWVRFPQSAAELPLLVKPGRFGSFPESYILSASVGGYAGITTSLSECTDMTKQVHRTAMSGVVVC